MACEVTESKFCENEMQDCGSLSSNVEKAGFNPCEPNEETDSGLTAAQRARIERNRLKARALQDARLVQRQHLPGRTETPKWDSGGGFLLEEEAAPAPAAAPRAPPAPLLDPAARPPCDLCGRPFACSHLYDTFDLSVCDACRDDDGAHSTMTRTEAKAEFLLKDCDLDLRPPPLRCVRRRNPHRGGGDMRLYLRAQVERRALEVWGELEALERERARRSEARSRTRHKQTQRRLRALRMDVRSSVYERVASAHRHEFGPESYDAAADLYRRACLTCAHAETYEKM